MKECQDSQANSSELICKLDEKPPLGMSILLAFQHIVTAFGGIVAVPLVVSSALGLPVEGVAFMVSATIFVSGITTFIQAKKIGPIGSGLPCIMGTDFTFVAPSLVVGVNMGLGLPGIFGATILGSFSEMILSRFIKPLMRFFPPIVTGTVVTLIGTTLLPVAMDWAAGGSHLAGTPEYGSLRNVLISVTVLLIIVFLNRYGKGIVGSASVLIGIVIGYLICLPLNMLDLQAVADARWFSLPQIFKYGVEFNIAALIAFIPAYLVTTIETVGVLIAVGESCESESSNKQVADGVLADGVGSFIAGFFGAGPNTSFSQNVGLIPLTRVASRHVVIIAGIILAILGIFPKLATLIAIMPNPVLGGAGIVMFGIVAASGIKTLGNVRLNNRNLIIIAVSLGIGLGITFRPDYFAQLPEILKTIFSSGISAGTVVALLLNILLKEEKTDKPSLV
ncbi:xanthine permease PbuX [Gottschalkia acidurici 9a]|uniref:Xanthine permease PbuX n=1 Tax=Gottschalkia acidurici (strain ATCC 7906 / DSM 604 / BCRC 14475 / CIP 104303 / KCTC 5404 / NCIMB 10678 / 9a) TaxID=1128398 RepID=K0B383_GOTA9|nr:nucleobase:cation symporter-2 family protein [Gottschalkia acidurici]AFS79884.1 xanthine permease PbuX [Gottschalkia acidurici 9a]